MALAANLRRLMANYSKGWTQGISSRALEKLIPVSYKTIDRMCDPYAGESPRLSGLDEIAAFFKVETWELLRQPDNGLTATNTQQRRAGITVKS